MFTFNEISNQNLDWFWNAWVFQPGYGDLALTTFDKNTSKVHIKNIGGLPVPIVLKLIYKDGKEELIKRTAEVWSQGDSSVAIDIDTIKNLQSIQLNTTQYPDSDKTNNSLEIKL
jgi:aminopeptidase N